MLVRLTPALTSPFSAEEEVSWGSQPPVCLLGQECPSLAHPSPPQGQPQLCTLAVPPPLASWPSLTTCNGNSSSLRQDILRSGAGNPRNPAQARMPSPAAREKLDWSGEFSLPSGGLLVGFQDASWDSRCLVKALPALLTFKREGRELMPGPPVWAWIEFKRGLS